MTPSDPPTDSGKDISPVFSKAGVLVKWVWIFVFGLLNVVVFWNAHRLAPDNHTRQVFLYSLQPRFWPDWFSLFLWTLACGVMLEALVRLSFVRRNFESWLRWPIPDRLHFGTGYSEQLLSQIQRWPLERWILGWSTVFFRTLPLFFVPKNLPLMIRGSTILAAGWILLTHTYWGTILIATVRDHLFFIPSLPGWLFCRWYYYPLCDFFCYGVVSWALILTAVAVFPAVTWIYLQSNRWSRLSRRHEAVRLIGHYLVLAIGIILLGFVIGLLPMIGKKLAGFLSACLDVLSWPILFYASLCDLFCYGKISWTLFFFLLLATGAGWALFRAGRAVARSPRCDTITNKVVTAISIALGSISIVVVAYHAQSLFALAGPSVSLAICRPATLFHYFYRNPLCDLFCYGTVSWRLVAALLFAGLLAWGFHRSGNAVARSEWRETMTRRVIRFLLAGCVVILLVMSVCHVLFVQTLIGGLALGVRQLPEYLYFQCYQIPLDDLFCYGRVSWILPLMILLGFAAAWGIRRTSRIIIESSYCKTATRIARIAVIFVLILVIFEFRTFFYVPIENALSLPSRIHVAYISSLHDLFSYGIVSWPLAGAVTVAFGGVGLVLYVKNRLLRSPHRDRISANLRFVMQTTVWGIAIVATVWATLVSLLFLHDRFTAVASFPIWFFERFLYGSYCDLFCYGKITWFLILLPILALMSSVALYRAGTGIAKSDDRQAVTVTTVLLLCGGITGCLLWVFRSSLFDSRTVTSLLAESGNPVVPFCDFFCYHIVSFRLVSVFSISTVAAIGLLWCSRSIARMTSRRKITFFYYGLFFACAAVPATLFAPVATDGITWTVAKLESMNRNLVFLPICDWLCYGTLSVELFVLFSAIPATAWCLYLFAKTMSRSSRRKRIGLPIVSFLLIVLATVILFANASILFPYFDFLGIGLFRLFQNTYDHPLNEFWTTGTMTPSLVAVPSLGIVCILLILRVIRHPGDLSPSEMKVS